MGRPVRGARQSSFSTVDQNPSLATLDSAFQLQEYIALLVRLDPHDVHRIVALPGKKEAADAGEQPPEEERPVVDEACWIYEQLRRLAQDLTHPLITTLQQECTRQTCPEMKAGEWLYLCVAHGNSGGMEHCCAIDYIVHTLDSATALLNSPRAFPSRISIPSTSHRHFPSLARRLGRIFAHAYHHHRAAFESAEAEGALYARFLALARRFDLVPAEFLVIPPRATDAEGEDAAPPRVTLLTRDKPEATAFSGSPRMGGRSRTDTMYLPGGFAGTAGDSPSPRRMPSPLAGTLLAEHVDEVVVQNAVVPEKSRVYARDFALAPEMQKMPVLEPKPNVEPLVREEKDASEDDDELEKEMEEEEEEEENEEGEQEQEEEESSGPEEPRAPEQEVPASKEDEDVSTQVVQGLPTLAEETAPLETLEQETQDPQLQDISVDDAPPKTAEDSQGDTRVESALAPEPAAAPEVPPEASSAAPVPVASDSQKGDEAGPVEHEDLADVEIEAGGEGAGGGDEEVPTAAVEDEKDPETADADASASAGERQGESDT